MLKLIVRFFTWLSPLLQRLGICATTGFIAGAIAGFLLWCYATFIGIPSSFTAAEIIEIALLLTLCAWIILMFTLVILGNLAFSSVWYSSLFNAFLTCLLTIVAVYKFNVWVIAYLIGMIIGIWVGLLLCYINNIFKNYRYDMHRENTPVRGQELK